MKILPKTLIYKKLNTNNFVDLRTNTGLRIIINSNNNSFLEPNCTITLAKSCRNGRYLIKKLEEKLQIQPLEGGSNGTKKTYNFYFNNSWDSIDKFLDVILSEFEKSKFISRMKLPNINYISIIDKEAFYGA